MLKLVFLDTPVRAVTFLPHPRLPIPDVFVYSPLPVTKRAPPPQAPSGYQGWVHPTGSPPSPRLVNLYLSWTRSIPTPSRLWNWAFRPPHVYDGRFSHCTWNTPVAFHSCPRPPYSVG